MVAPPFFCFIAVTFVPKFKKSAPAPGSRWYICHPPFPKSLPAFREELEASTRAISVSHFDSMIFRVSSLI